MKKEKYLILIGGIVTVSVVAVLLSMNSPSMTLDQIIQNRDCKALMEWEEEHMFDEDLQITKEQTVEGMKLGFECGIKALQNEFK